MTPLATHLITILPIIFISLILPWFSYSRRGILFGVTVPLHFAESPQARAILRTFRLATWIIILTVFSALVLIFWLASATTASTLFAAIIPAELIAAYLLWLRAHRAVKPFAATIPIERHADLIPISTTMPLLVIVLSLLHMAATAFWLRLHWNQIAPPAGPCIGTRLASSMAGQHAPSSESSPLSSSEAWPSCCSYPSLSSSPAPPVRNPSNAAARLFPLPRSPGS